MNDAQYNGHRVAFLQSVAATPNGFGTLMQDFRADEIAHKDEALAHGAEQAPGYKLLSESIKAGVRLAIKLSERI